MGSRGCYGEPREACRRFEWPCPGDLLQIDTKRFQRFTRPGHAVTGMRDRTGKEMRMRVGHEFCHSIVDDHSRLAYSELHPDERAQTVTGFVLRALAFLEANGIEPRRLQTDNAFAYVNNRSLRELLATRGIEHRRIPPRMPKRNGKVERYQQTLKRVGPRPGLPLIRCTSEGPATLAPPLQPHPPPQRDPQPGGTVLVPLKASKR